MNYPIVQLSEIAEVIRGVTFARSDSYDEPQTNSLPIIRAGNIQNGKLLLQDDLVFVDELKIKSHQKILKNDIIMCTSSGSSSVVGKCALSSTDWNGSFRAFNAGIRANETAIPSYIYYYLASDHFRNWSSQSSGANIKNIRSSELKRFLIPLPPLPMQKKIVRVLDKARELIDLREEQIRLLDELVQSVFYDMFGDPVGNPMGWEVKTIEQLVIKEKYAIKRGPFGGALKKEIFIESGYLVYEQYHALNNDFNFGRYYISEDKFNEMKPFEVKSNDIIISCSGVYLGKLAIVPPGSPKGIINQALMKISLDNSIMENLMYIYIFTDTNFKEKFFGKKIGSGIPNFPPMSDFRKFDFICPPISLQRTFVRKVQKIEIQKSLMQQSLEEMKDNYNCLMQRAFKGELFS